MKQFFKYLFASILGTGIALFIAGFIFFAVIIGSIVSSISSSTEEKVITVKENSVLHVKLDETIKEQVSGNPFENIDFSTFKTKKQLGIRDIIKAIEKAKSDDKIKGIFLDLSIINAGMSTIEEIRNALEDFKASKKFILCYSEVYTQRTYYLASVADKIYLNPAGLMELRGLATQLMFFKNALEKLNIEMQIIRGTNNKFKSAVEPFMYDKMSDANRKQIAKYIHSLWNNMLTEIAESRGLTVEEINKLANEVAVRNAKDAVKYKFVDQLTFRDEVLSILREKLGLNENDDINSLSLAEYYNNYDNPFEKLKEKKKVKKGDHLAIIYANGEITGGESEDGTMGSETISKAIREARLDENVKAIVLRVNSPGGSALASDVIWREVVLAKKVKPVVVSMGDVAASGGYYISCAANKIFADANTVTGSIGVFGMIPNAKGFFNNKLGINIDTVKTNHHADMLTVFRKLTPDEISIIQQGVDEVYDDFITKVSEGRGLSKEMVDSIGQGRIWSGVDALKIGLVDEIGDINDAVSEAAKMAKLEEGKYAIVEYPKAKDPFEALFQIAGDEIKASFVKSELGDNYVYYKHLKNATKLQSGIMAKMPFEIEVY
ncbi:MAG: signal peptide peptidase SppA [Vicingaceae bacterium]